MQVSGLSGVIAIAGGSSHGLAVKSNGSAWGWGRNSSGQLGDGSLEQSTTPVQLSDVENAVAVAAANTHSVILLSDGTVWCCGANFYGQNGDGESWSTTPVQMQ